MRVNVPKHSHLCAYTLTVHWGKSSKGPRGFPKGCPLPGSQLFLSGYADMETKAQEKKTTLKNISKRSVWLVQVQFKYNSFLWEFFLPCLRRLLSETNCESGTWEIKKLLSKMMDWDTRDHNNEHRVTGNTYLFPEERSGEASRALVYSRQMVWCSPCSDLDAVPVWSIERNLNQKAKLSIFSSFDPPLWW